MLIIYNLINYLERSDENRRYARIYRLAYKDDSLEK